MWSHLLALVCALLLLPAQALAGAREKVAALAPSGLVLVMDEGGNELVSPSSLPHPVGFQKQGRIGLIDVV
jgi:serine-type D-Ala-D-Ala carboxypeptidase/endopeptidase (penicillin-binding protein 4)